jgi:hypothetical protein
VLGFKRTDLWKSMYVYECGVGKFVLVRHENRTKLGCRTVFSYLTQTTYNDTGKMQTKSFVLNKFSLYRMFGINGAFI